MIYGKQAKQQNHNNDSSAEKTVFSIDHKWDHIAKLLKKQVGKTEFRNWISPLSVCSIQNRALEIAAPTRFIRDWVSMHYTDKIQRIWNAAYPNDIIGIDVIIAPELNPLRKPANNTGAEKDISFLATPYAKEDSPKKNSYTPSTKHENCILDPRFTFETFVTDTSNELAVAAAKRIVESPDVSFNPLFLHSGVGLGKTHLMHAIGSSIREQNSSRKIMYMSAEKFMYQFIRSIQRKNTVSFKETFRSIDILMIDDIQFLAGKNKIQEEFFHTFNALIEENKQIVISADRPPSDIEGLSERLRSRLGWGLVADIQPTTYDLRFNILRSKIEHIPRINISEDILKFLALKITSNVRELEGALNRIVMQTELTGKEVNLDVVRLALQDLLRANERVLTIEDIQKVTAEHYDIRITDMHSTRRARNIARPRQVAMHISKSLTSASLPEIGRKFGGRDHTTVLYAVRKINELLSQDNSLAKDIDVITNTIKHI